MKKYNTLSFIERAIKIHGDKYSYDKTNYINCKTHILIFCKSCEYYFSQIPDYHINGNGCPICGVKNRTSSKSRFIEQAKFRYGDKYNYDNVIYINNSIEVSIYCNSCQSFFTQTPNYHLNHGNCVNCGPFRRLTKDIFVRESNKVHVNKYDYSKVEFKRSNIKVLIICNNCNNEFWQTPCNHMTGHGCYVCSRKSTANKLKLTNEQYIEICKEKHGNRYDYSKTHYINSKTKVLIICRACKEEFLQNSYKHSNGQGCPKCNFIFDKGKYYSTKMHKYFKYDSGWEKEKMIQYDSDPEVIFWQRCEDKIKYFNSKLKTNRNYCPDFEIFYKDKIIVEEIKGWLGTNAKEKFLEAKKFYNNSNKKYVMITKLPHQNEFIEVNLTNFEGLNGSK